MFHCSFSSAQDYENSIRRWIVRRRVLGSSVRCHNCTALQSGHNAFLRLAIPIASVSGGRVLKYETRATKTRSRGRRSPLTVVRIYGAGPISGLAPRADCAAAGPPGDAFHTFVFVVPVSVYTSRATNP
ncbi:hypothetical protein EVAR_49996_1 [Eumeta japonica]|uniref:Uncharacterized protein n=1 Tax=Eumeta variegata TaxID=151549 RepID=A0A4C1XSM5_EUMVA|nr:hypothetical protein EVAR_49996_1 [Eumeta japonica]